MRASPAWYQVASGRYSRGTRNIRLLALCEPDPGTILATVLARQPLGARFGLCARDRVRLRPDNCFARLACLGSAATYLPWQLLGGNPESIFLLPNYRYENGRQQGR